MWMDLVVRVFGGDALESYCKVSVQASSCLIFVINRSRHGASYEPASRLSPLHSRPGAFIAQIAAINTAFARGKMVKVSAIAIMGHSIMLIHSGQWKLVSANNADGTTM
jgi:hypothetical protein